MGHPLVVVVVALVVGVATEHCVPCKVLLICLQRNVSEEYLKGDTEVPSDSKF